MVAAKTSGTPPGGLDQDLAVLKSSFLMESSADLAYSTNGIAASRSFIVDCFYASTLTLMTAHLSASI